VQKPLAAKAVFSMRLPYSSSWLERVSKFGRRGEAVGCEGCDCGWSWEDLGTEMSLHSAPVPHHPSPITLSIGRSRVGYQRYTGADLNSSYDGLFEERIGAHRFPERSALQYGCQRQLGQRMRYARLLGASAEVSAYLVNLDGIQRYSASPITYRYLG
jgi:hypothetical protein